VGRFSDPIARELLDPADRVAVDLVRAERVPPEAADRIRYDLVRRSGLTIVPRTVSIDEAIRDHAAGQVVVLGAGLDTRAWRMPELARVSVFEVDHVASQRDKLNRPGVSGDSDPWEGLESGHVGKCVEEVPAGVAGAGGADGRGDPRGS
jgi:hypothetical protein